MITKWCNGDSWTAVDKGGTGEGRETINYLLWSGLKACQKALGWHRVRRRLFYACKDTHYRNMLPINSKFETATTLAILQCVNRQQSKINSKFPDHSETLIS